MTLSELSVKRPVFISMVTFAMLVLGVVSYKRLSTDLYPDVSFPFVSVVTVYPGASPADIETQLTQKIEDALVAIGGLDAISSQSYEGYCVVILKFKLSTSLDRVSNEVREKVSAIRSQLPDGIKEPVVSRVDIGALPILTYSASASLPADLIRQIAQDQIKPALEQIAGVAEVRIKGGLLREIQVKLNQTALNNVHLSALQILEQIKQSNLNIPGGSVTYQGQDLSIRTVAQFESIDMLKQLIVATDSRGGQVRLADIAQIEDGFKDVKTLVRTNTQPAVALEVVKQNGANTVTTTHAVKKKLQELAQELPRDYKLTLLVDQSVFIEANAHEVSIALWFGGLMAILIILIFMMDLRSTLISAIALPTSVIGTFVIMYGMNFTLNMMTLLGLSLAIGLLIDDAVVVRENIFKFLEKGESPMQAAIKGTQEVQLAVLATTLTIVAVFVPVAFMDGMVGQFFKQFGLTVSGAVMLSLWVAFTLDPMLSSRFSKTIDHSTISSQTGPLNSIRVYLTRFFTALDRFYLHTLKTTLTHKKKTFTLVVFIFLGSMMLTSMMGSDFIPPEDRAQAIVKIEMPVGISIEEASKQSLALEQQAMALPYVQALYSIIGENEESNRISWRLIYRPKEQRPVGIETLKTQLRTLLAKQQNLKVNVLNPPAIEGLGEWSPLMLHISGPDLNTLKELNQKLLTRIAAVPGVAEITSSMRPIKHDIGIDIHRQALAQHRLQPAHVGMSVRLAIHGEEAGYLRGQLPKSAQDNPNFNFTKTADVPIRVRLDESTKQNQATIQEITLPSINLVKLGDVATLQSVVAPSVIERYQRERSFILGISNTGRALGEVTKDIEQALEQDQTLQPYFKKGQYRHITDGDAKNQQESQESMQLALFLAVVFIYIVLAAQFESFVHPFTIMLSLPLAMVGAWLALFLAGCSLSISSSIGVILLMGLVTKNSILLIDSALQECQQGSTPQQAIIKAGEKRLRPILMTSSAMVLGMLPTALGSGAGSEFRAPMAIAVIGGVITSTLLTLIVIPIVYLWIEQASQFIKHSILKKKST